MCVCVCVRGFGQYHNIAFAPDYFCSMPRSYDFNWDNWSMCCTKSGGTRPLKASTFPCSADGELDAARAYDCAARELHGADVHGKNVGAGRQMIWLNFPTLAEDEAADAAVAKAEAKAAAAREERRQARCAKGTSAFTGVFLCRLPQMVKVGKVWGAKLRKKWLGAFKDEMQAAKAVDQALRERRRADKSAFSIQLNFPTEAEQRVWQKAVELAEDQKRLAKETKCALGKRMFGRTVEQRLRGCAAKALFIGSFAEQLEAARRPNALAPDAAAEKVAQRWKRRLTSDSDNASKLDSRTAVTVGQQRQRQRQQSRKRRARGAVSCDACHSDRRRCDGRWSTCSKYAGARVGRARVSCDACHSGKRRCDGRWSTCIKHAGACGGDAGAASARRRGRRLQPSGDADKLTLALGDRVNCKWAPDEW